MVGGVGVKNEMGGGGGGVVYLSMMIVNVGKFGRLNDNSVDGESHSSITTPRMNLKGHHLKSNIFLKVKDYLSVFSL